VTQKDTGNLGLSIAETDTGTDVLVSGELDVHTCGELEKALVELAHAGRNHVVLDLGDVAFIDSSGLRALIVGQRALSERGGELELRNLSPMASRLLAVTGLNDVFGLDEDQ
jgi:anti-anti-sigma factor